MASRSRATRRSRPAWLSRVVPSTARLVLGLCRSCARRHCELATACQTDTHAHRLILCHRSSSDGGSNAADASNVAGERAARLACPARLGPAWPGLARQHSTPPPTTTTALWPNKEKPKGTALLTFAVAASVAQQAHVEPSPLTPPPPPTSPLPMPLCFSNVTLFVRL